MSLETVRWLGVVPLLLAAGCGSAAKPAVDAGAGDLAVATYPTRDMAAPVFPCLADGGTFQFDVQVDPPYLGEPYLDITFILDQPAEGWVNQPVASDVVGSYQVNFIQQKPDAWMMAQIYTPLSDGGEIEGPLGSFVMSALIRMWTGHQDATCSIQLNVNMSVVNGKPVVAVTSF